MPGLLGTRRKELPKNSPSWSYNLHNHSALLESDSESDTSSSSPIGSQKPVIISEDARLLRELDLSSRPDDAVYNANPWTIAKVNAASRPNVVSPAVTITKAHAVSRKRPTGPIADAFKKQLSRPGTKVATKNSVSQKPYSIPDQSRKSKAAPQSLPINHAVFNSFSRPSSQFPSDDPSNVASTFPSHVNTHECLKHVHANIEPPLEATSLTNLPPAPDSAAHIPRSEDPNERILPLVPGTNLVNAIASDLQTIPLTPEDIFMTEDDPARVALSYTFPSASTHSGGLPRPSIFLSPSTRDYTCRRHIRSPMSSPIPSRLSGYPPRMAASSPFRGDSNIPHLSNFLLKRPSSTRCPSKGRDSHPISTAIPSSSTDPPFRRPSPSFHASSSSRPLLSHTHLQPKGPIFRRPPRDAYDAFPVSPDSNWSSLPTPAKRLRPALEKTSGKFKISQFAKKLPVGAAQSSTQYSGSSRITTYLPPPPPKSGTEERAGPGVTSWHVKKAGQPFVPKRSKAHFDEPKPVPPLNKNTHHLGEANARFEPDNLEQRYRKVRQAARE
ncbi:unnamed protein product [Somion occarium]